MNVLFLNPTLNAKTINYIRVSGLPLGILSIATYLKNNGYNVKILDRMFDYCNFEEMLGEYSPDVVGVALMSNNTILDSIAIYDFFSAHGIPVIMGGTYASIVPEMIIREKKADAVIVSEGEQTWLELVKAIENKEDISTIAGLWYPDENGEPVYTGDRDFMDLSLLGPSDFTLITDLPRYFQTAYSYDRMLYLYMSKGCTGNCTFCFNHFFHRCERRVRPVEHIMDEIEYLTEHFALKTVYFADELWGVYKEERESFFAEIEKRKMDFIWGCQTRIGVLKSEDIQKMYDHGCRWLMFGIEAPPGRLAKMTNKKLPYELVEPTLQACNAIGMLTNISFILNYPHSTEQDLKETVSFALSLSPTYYSVHFYFPLEKSLMYDQLVEEGLYHPPKTLEETANLVFTDYIYSDFSEVADLDFKVVRSCFMVQALFRKAPHEKGASFALKAIKGTLLNFRTQRNFERIRGLLFSARYFFSVVGTVILHPRIRKKYGFRFRFR